MTYLVLTLFLLTFSLVMVGLDIVIHDNRRTELQYTLDRAVLAAAPLNQTRSPESVARDYVAKAGLTSDLTSVRVTDSGGSRNVRLEALGPSGTSMLPQILGTPVMVSAIAEAEQGSSKLEISLVLDVSGSMAGTKLANLKLAASEFVDTMITDDGRRQVSISLVPYNGQVNLGPTLRAQYNVTQANGIANADCLDLTPEAYAARAVPNSLPIPQTAFVDSYSPTSQSFGYYPANASSATPYSLNRWCPDMAQNILRPANDNVSLLQAQINGLTAIGATSINAGMKWGLTMLDPASQPMFSRLSGQGLIPSTFANRPVAYTDTETTKVIVLMTDGQNFAEERMNPGYRTETSPIWRSIGDGNYSILHSGRPTWASYWIPHLGQWAAAPWNSGMGTQRLSWQNVWSAQRVSWVAWQLYARALGSDSASMSAQYSAAMTRFRSQTSTSAMDAQLQAVCTQAKEQNIIVYGIAFEAPAQGEAVIQACSTSAAHYFDATGLDIRTAFRTIATNLTQLRLTQ